MSDYLHIGTSILAIIGMLAMAFGYRKSLFVGDAQTRFFVLSMVLLAVGFLIRRFLWDIAEPIYPRLYIHNASINTILNLIAIAAAYYGLQARWYLIPSEDRRKWRWWNAWMHPDRCRILRLVTHKEKPND